MLSDSDSRSASSGLPIGVFTGPGTGVVVTNTIHLVDTGSSEVLITL